jgi:biopolymer transport protein ExbD
MGRLDIGVGGGRARRRSVDSEVNMIPMIDLLMVTISFLLITAVWTHRSRVDTEASVPRTDSQGPPGVPQKQLHIMMQSDDRFVLVWKHGTTVVDSIDIPRKPVRTRDGGDEVVRFPDLAERVEAEWKARGQHASPTDPRADEAVIHASNGTAFKDLIGAIDAIHQPHRNVRLASGKTEQLSAFAVVFAVD